ncbi:uncharacterized protein LOC129963022 [Argiope bruennichi]|uniref:uncharacterized protein LOC129963022 n=1 Tax=Argiope bruennichi TaxID=94029 RepID=UPI002495578A|nr:uncharacterized protein LOC129963022 [Argiope bruennichi]
MSIRTFDVTSFQREKSDRRRDPDISNEDKYQYLIQSTLKSSRAREVVESFPPTAENYVQAIECLKARFGREDVLVEVYTLVVHLRGEKGKVKIRAIIDSASQRSYILKSTGQRLNYQPHRRESLRHSLFGGASTEVCHHDVYRAFLTDFDLTYNCNFEVLGQETICATIPPVADGIWMKELSENNIHLSDQYHGPIELLIGADVAETLLTGGYKLLPSGLVAIETKLEWTVMGRTRREKGDGNTDLIVTSVLAGGISETDLWNLDIIGIKDLAEKQSKTEKEEVSMQHFLKTLKRLPDGRYEVSLPWLEGMQPPANNRMIAERRLKGTIQILQAKNLLESYEDVFHEWLKEEIIEPVDITRLNDLVCTYLPHWAVIKENSTTKIRPVFDASAKQKNELSLNSCLENGPNLVELIPSILNRFRLGAFGIIADIKKAFLQISISDKDREYLRFLWFENGDPDKLKIYRHKRVVFGINASPFLLGATISYHLDHVPEHLQGVAKKPGFWEEVEAFIEHSKEIMMSVKFDLRGCRFSKDKSTFHRTGEKSPAQEENVSVLGLEWNPEDDTLRCAYKKDVFEAIPLTKRSILSSANQLFDPLGILSPVTVRFKILMQDCWRAKLSWDAELSDELAKKFLKLKRDLTYVDNLTIPRRLVINLKERNNLSFHVFCDASQLAYATCIYLRSENEEGVSCQLVQSRSRVAPLKPVTVSRLELDTIGIRLMTTIKRDLHMEDVTTFYWTDSMNALHWIRNEEDWGVFVMNRVREIRNYSSKGEWNHIPGTFNPADLPSRGCSVVTLLSQHWHDGPSWLMQDEKYWAVSEAMVDKKIINSEKKKTIVTLAATKNEEFDYLTNISSFDKIARIIAWIPGFVRNCKKVTQHTSQNLEIEELSEAETIIWKIIQKTSFKTVSEERLRNLRPFVDPKGLIRIKTQLLMRKDFENFKYPILLPPDHIVVHKMIMHRHKILSHCGIQTLMSSLREHFWLIRSRKTIRRVLKSCITCKRFEA